MALLFLSQFQTKGDIFLFTKTNIPLSGTLTSCYWYICDIMFVTVCVCVCYNLLLCMVYIM